MGRRIRPHLNVLQRGRHSAAEVIPARAPPGEKFYFYCPLIFGIRDDRAENDLPLALCPGSGECPIYLLIRGRSSSRLGFQQWPR